MLRYSVLVILLSCSAFAQNDDSISAVYIVSVDDGNPHALFPYPVRASGLAVSPNRTKIAYSGNGPDIWMVNVDGGNPINLTNTPDIKEFDPAWSPDGTQIAYTALPTGSFASDILVLNIATNKRINLTHSPSSDFHPTWSTDGAYIAFVSDLDDTHGIHRASVSGDTAINLVESVGGVRFASPAWSPDGSRIAFVAIVDRKREIRLLNLLDNSTLTLSGSYVAQDQPAWSPDGTRIAFSALKDGKRDIFVTDHSGQRDLNASGGVGVNEHPVWLSNDQIVFASRRSRNEIAENLGPDTTLTIIEGGGLSIAGRSGDTPPVRLQRQTPGGKIEYLPLSQIEAERLLRQQGIQSPNLDSLFKP